MQNQSFPQTGGAGSTITPNTDYAFNRYSTHIVQLVGNAGTVRVLGPGDEYTDVSSLSANDTLVIEGLYDGLQVVWVSASGGVCHIRSYNLDEEDGG